MRGEDKAEEGGGVLVESQTRSTKSKKKLKVEQDKVETEKNSHPAELGRLGADAPKKVGVKRHTQLVADM